MTAPLPVVTSQDGPRITINDYLKTPLLMPRVATTMFEQQFLADALLRQADRTESGAVQYEESAPIFAPGTIEIRAESGEVPVIETVGGVTRVVFAEERAGAITITDEDVRRKRLYKVNDKMEQARNTLVRTWDDAVIQSVLTHPSVRTVTISTPWDSESATQRKDILAGAKLISQSVDAQGSKLGLKMDTLLVNETTSYDLIGNEEFNKEYVGNIASENLRYVGKLPNKIMQYDVPINDRVPDGKAIGLMRMKAGFISDELPLTASALYRDEPRKQARCDLQRASAIGLDQPLAIVIFNGV